MIIPFLLLAHGHPCKLANDAHCSIESEIFPHPLNMDEVLGCFLCSYFAFGEHLANFVNSFIDALFLVPPGLNTVLNLNMSNTLYMGVGQILKMTTLEGQSSQKRYLRYRPTSPNVPTYHTPKRRPSTARFLPKHRKLSLLPQGTGISSSSSCS